MTEVTRFAVMREEDDPLASRVSIGGTPEVGYYLVFRGDPDEVLAMLKAAVTVASAALPSGRYQDKRS